MQKRRCRTEPCAAMGNAVDQNNHGGFRCVACSGQLPFGVFAAGANRHSSRTAWAWSQDFVPYAGILYAAIVIRLGMLAYQRVYRFDGAFSYVQDTIRVFNAVAVGSLLIIAWAFLFRGGYAFREFSYSRSVFVLDFAVALGLYLAFHLSVRFAQTRFRRSGINLIPTLIVGTNVEAEQAIRELADRRTWLPRYRLILEF